MMFKKLDSYFDKITDRFKGMRTIIFSRFMLLAGLIFSVDPVSLNIPHQYTGYFVIAAGLFSEYLRHKTTTPVGKK